MGKKFEGGHESKLGYSMFYDGKPKPEKSQYRGCEAAILKGYLFAEAEHKKKLAKAKKKSRMR